MPTSYYKDGQHVVLPAEPEFNLVDYTSNMVRSIPLNNLVDIKF